MQATIDRSQLLSALGMASKTLGRNITQATAGFFLKADAATGLLEVITTDLEGFTHCKVQARVKTSGTVVTLPRIADLLGKAKTQDVDLIQTPSHLGIKYGSNKSNFHTWDSSGYPKLPVVATAGTFDIDSDLLRALINNTVAFVSSDTSKPSVTGVRLRFEPGMVSALSTNLMQVAYWETAISTGLTGDHEVILFARHLKDLAAILPKGQPVTINISATNGFVVFGFGATAKYINSIAGAYPNLFAILPSTSEADVMLQKDPLVEALERAQVLVAGKGDYANYFTLTVDGSDVKVEGRNQDNGDIQETWQNPTPTTNGPIKATLHVKLALEGLSTIPTDNVVIEQLPGALSPDGKRNPGPIRFRPEGDSTNFHLLIPYIA